MTASPAVAERAAAAWSEVSKRPSIIRTIAGVHPMPAGVALDMVQGDDCERDDAVTAILEAATNEMRAKMPNEDVGDFKDLAEAAFSYVRGEGFRIADAYLDQIAFGATDIGVSALAGMYGPPGTPTRPDPCLCDRWRAWAGECREQIKLCAAIVKAAYPN